MPLKFAAIASIVALALCPVFASDFSLVEMAKQNRAREKAAEARQAEQPPNERTVYELKVPKTQAQYDYERKSKRENEVDRAIREAESILRNLDADMTARAKRQERMECDRWRSTIDNVTIGSDAMETVMNVIGYPDSVSKYRSARGEVEDWRYQNSQCIVSVDVVNYRVVDVFTSGF